MTPTQTFLGVAIVVLLVALAGYYGWRQLRTLRTLRDPSSMPVDEFHFVRGQVRRRLLGSALMLFLAAAFVVLMFLEKPAAALQALGEQNAAQNQQREFNDSERSFMRVYGGAIIAVLLLLMAIIALAGFEFFAIRRFSVQQMRRIQADRRAMIARETARLRAERNGEG